MKEQEGEEKSKDFFGSMSDFFNKIIDSITKIFEPITKFFDNIFGSSVKSKDDANSSKGEPNDAQNIKGNNPENNPDSSSCSPQSSFTIIHGKGSSPDRSISPIKPNDSTDLNSTYQEYVTRKKSDKKNNLKGWTAKFACVFCGIIMQDEGQFEIFKEAKTEEEKINVVNNCIRRDEIGVRLVEDFPELSKKIVEVLVALNEGGLSSPRASGLDDSSYIAQPSL